MPKKGNSVQRQREAGLLRQSGKKIHDLQRGAKNFGEFRDAYAARTGGPNDTGPDGEKGAQNWTSGTVKNLPPESALAHFQTRNDRHRDRAAGESHTIRGAGDGGGFSYNAFSRGFRITDDRHRPK